MKTGKFPFVLALAFALVLTVVPVASARTLDGAISGLVLLPNGKPAAGVKVQAFAGKYTGLYSKDWERFGTPVTTGRNGAYKITVPPGTYRVWFEPADLETYCMEAYPNAPTPYAGDDIVVRAGRTVTRVSVTLDTGPGVLEGTVFDATNGQPIEGIDVALGFQAYAIINNQFGSTHSDVDGHYRFAGLKSFNWGAWAQDQRGVTPYYLEVLRFDENLWVDQGGVTTVDFDMEPEGWISASGYLTDESLQPIEGVEVYAMLQESEGYWDYAMTTTDANGHFEFANLPAGWWMFFAGGNGYEYRYYHGGDEAGEEFWHTRGTTMTLGEWTLFPLAP